jgi:VIT1/CCC1 family predicted Fe2+/Mn2+ transporter
MLNSSLKTGLSFGLTSGVITTLGLLVGLAAGTESHLAVLGGILTIAIADAFSDALGIHLSEESEGAHTPREIWQSTFATFFAKFFFALTFAVPVLLFSLDVAALVAVVWGFLVLGITSFLIARTEKIAPWKVIGEHLLIAAVVVVATHFLGKQIALLFAAR